MSWILQVLSSNKIEALNQAMDTCDSYFNSLLQSENEAQNYQFDNINQICILLRKGDDTR